MSVTRVDLRARLEGSSATMLAQVRRVVEAESPTGDLRAVRQCAEVVAELGEVVTGAAPRWVETGGRPHLLWQLGSGPRVGLLGHFDTVWPVGTLADRPYREEAGRAFGPGIFDMKCGVVQALHAAAAAGASVDILLTSDEETGSGTSRALIEELATGWRAALVLEASAAGALKTARKGVSSYVVRVTGRQAHAGLEPEKGANALVELAQLVQAAGTLADPAAGTTVTPTLARAGTAMNVVPGEAELHLDVRAFSTEEQLRVDAALRGRAAEVPGTTIEVAGGPNRPPMAASTSATLFDLARRLYRELGYGELAGVAVGGGSDGNLTAGVGTPTLDGLGAVGDGAHAAHEHIVLDEVPRRAALVAALTRELLG